MMMMREELAIYEALPLPLQHVVGAIATAFGVRVFDLLGRERSKQLTSARAAFMLWLYEGGFSYPEVGRMLRRDHTTVMVAVRKARRQRDERLNERDNP